MARRRRRREKPHSLGKAQGALTRTCNFEATLNFARPHSQRDFDHRQQRLANTDTVRSAYRNRLWTFLILLFAQMAAAKKHIPIVKKRTSPAMLRQQISAPIPQKRRPERIYDDRMEEGRNRKDSPLI